MKAHLKKRFGLYLVLFVVLYLVVGAILPFVRYKQLSVETIQAADAVVAAIAEAEGISVDRAMLLESNTQALEERIRLLNLAEKSIVMSTFDMREGQSSDDIAAMLLQKADEGVQVSLLIDGFNGSFRLPGKAFFQAMSSHPNIEIRLYNPINFLTPWTSQGRMHDKYMIVDDLAYILGGRNTFDYFLGDYDCENKSLDREVLIYNTARGTESRESSLWQVKDYFDQLWNSKFCKVFGEKEGLSEKPSVQRERQRLNAVYERMLSEQPELFAEFDYEVYTYETENVTLLSGDTGIYGKEPEVLYQLGELMKQAKDNVVIHTPYAVCNSYMYGVLEEIEEAAPEAVMMVNSIENGDNFCASSDYMRNKQKIVDTGISLYEYDGGTSYHGKSIVIDDDISIIGSYNFDLRSTYMDTELMLVIKSEKLNAELRGNMEKMQEQCRCVLSDSKYEVPDGLTIAEVPFAKRVAMKVFGFVVQAFRYLL